MFWELGGPMFALCELFIIEFQFSKDCDHELVTELETYCHHFNINERIKFQENSQNNQKPS